MLTLTHRNSEHACMLICHTPRKVLTEIDGTQQQDCRQYHSLWINVCLWMVVGSNPVASKVIISSLGPQVRSLTLIAREALDAG